MIYIKIMQFLNKLGCVELGKKRGEIEKWLRRIFFSNEKENYIVYIRFREGGIETLRPVPGKLIDDIRGDCIIVKNDIIPFHRVEEIRDNSGRVVYKRRKSE